MISHKYFGALRVGLLALLLLAIFPFHLKASAPSKGEGHFFEGVAANRSGEFSKAMHHFETASSLGFQHDDMAFEIGWSFLGLQKYDDAIAHLQKFESKKPGHGQTSAFLGRAYLAKGDYKKAEHYLAQAIKRNPRLKKGNAHFLAMARQQGGKLAKADRLMQRWGQEDHQTPAAHAFFGKKIEREKSQSAKEGGMNVTIAGGGTNNAISLGHNVPLPTDISQQQSAFGRFSLNGFYRFVDKPKDSFTFSGQFLTDFYEESAHLSLSDFFENFNYRHRFNDKWAAGVLLNNEHSFVHTSNFRNQTNIRPAIGWKFKDWWITEASYTLGLANYFPPTTPVQDRDSFSHTFASDSYWKIVPWKVRGRSGSFLVFNNADGNDFDFYTLGSSISISRNIFWKLNGEIYGALQMDRYAKINSLPGFALKRRDNINTLVFQVSFPVFDRMNAFTRYSFIDHYSNINFYNFTQHVGSAGFVIDLI